MEEQQRWPCEVLVCVLKMGCIEYPHITTLHDYPGVRQVQPFHTLKPQNENQEGT